MFAILSTEAVFYGMQEGFTPSAYRSSRAEKSSPVIQNVEDFLDEDELAERKTVQVNQM